MKLLGIGVLVFLPFWFYVMLTLTLLGRFAILVRVRAWQFDGWEPEKWSRMRTFDAVALGVTILLIAAPPWLACIGLIALLGIGSVCIEAVLTDEQRRVGSEAPTATSTSHTDGMPVLNGKVHLNGSARANGSKPLCEQGDEAGEAVSVPDVLQAVLMQRWPALGEQRVLGILDRHFSQRRPSEFWEAVRDSGSVTLVIVVVLIVGLVAVPTAAAMGWSDGASLGRTVAERLVKNETKDKEDDEEKEDEHEDRENDSGETEASSTTSTSAPPGPGSTVPTDTTVASTTTSISEQERDAADLKEYGCTRDQNIAQVGSDASLDASTWFDGAYFGPDRFGVAPGTVGCLRPPQSIGNGVWFQEGYKRDLRMSITVVTADSGASVFVELDELAEQLAAGEVVRVWPAVSGDITNATTDNGVYLQVVELLSGPEILARYNAGPDETSRVTVRVSGDEAAWIVDWVEDEGSWFWPRRENGQVVVRQLPLDTEASANVTVETADGYSLRTRRDAEDVKRLVALTP
jgi:hypothetical protein